MHPARHILNSKRSSLKRLGTTAIEYCLIMALVFLAIVGAVAGLGNGVSNTLYNKLASVL